jgi:hypothetical protein
MNDLWMPREVSMPTQIPVRTARSSVASAMDALLLSLLAAATDCAIVSVIVWAYI